MTEPLPQDIPPRKLVSDEVVLDVPVGALQLALVDDAVGDPQGAVALAGQRLDDRQVPGPGRVVERDDLLAVPLIRVVCGETRFNTSVDA